MRSFIQLLLALCTLAFLIWIVWQGYGLLRLQQLGLNEATRPIIVLLAALCIICTFIITHAIGAHGDKVLRSQQFAQRLEIYEQVLQTDDLAEMEQQLVLVASAKVMKAFLEYRQSANPITLEQLMLTMREDLGQPVDYFARKEIQQLIK